MYDIEVINGRNYAIISEGEPAYEFLKSMNSKLVMKKLSSEPGAVIALTPVEMAAINRNFKRHDFNRLVQVGLISYKLDYGWNLNQSDVVKLEHYTFTEFGLEIMADLKANGGDIEIRLN